jgi:molybdopterin/thiamine biosynthesis adenylyltransferase
VFEDHSLLSQCSVLISGMNGLGAEIAKNIILSGIGRVVIHDSENAKISDLSSQVFFLFFYFWKFNVKIII